MTHALAPLRTPTPPDIKWLLNERAALMGEVARAQDKQSLLQSRREKLERQLSKATVSIAAAKCAEARARASIAALDATMTLVNSRVNQEAAGSVQAWAGRYGARGGLGVFIGEVLQRVAPEPVTTTVLIDIAATQFGVSFDAPSDRRSFRKSVSSALTSLLKRDLIEPLHDRGGGAHGSWRWGKALPTFAEMAREAAEAQWR